MTNFLLFKMVNTFVTSRQKNPDGSYSPNYRGSAKNLDLQRLRKQCVEAYQILNILVHLSKVAELEGWESFTPVNIDEHSLPPKKQAKRYLSRVSWTKDVRKRYLALSYRYVIIEGVTRKVSKDTIPHRVDKSTGIWTVNDDSTVTVWIKNTNKLIPNDAKLLEKGDGYDLSRGKNLRTRSPILYKRQNIVLPGDEILSLGFSQHAIVKMWIGYEDSLKEYINEHVAEYCTNTTFFGKQCSMDLPHYELPDVYPHPWWITHFEGVIFSHRASLLRKERERNEKPWYWKNKLFTSIPDKWIQTGYVWTGSLTPDTDLDLITFILSGKEVDINSISVPINADSRPLKSQAFLCKKYNYKGPYLLDNRGYIKIKFIE